MSELTKELAQELPEYYPIAEGTGNYKLLDPPAQQALYDDMAIEELGYAINPTDEMAPDLHVERETEVIIRSEERLYRRNVVIDGTLEVRGDLFATNIEIGNSGNLINNGYVNNSSEIPEFIYRLARLGEMVNVQPWENETVAHYRSRVLAEFAVVTAEGTPEDLIAGAASVLDIAKERVQLILRNGPGDVGLTVPVDSLERADLTPQEVIDYLQRLLPVSYSLSAVTEGTFTYITPSDYDSGNHDASIGYDGLDANGDPKDNGGTYAGVL